MWKHAETDGNENYDFSPIIQCGNSVLIASDCEKSTPHTVPSLDSAHTHSAALLNAIREGRLPRLVVRRVLLNELLQKIPFST